MNCSQGKFAFHLIFSPVEDKAVREFDDDHAISLLTMLERVLQLQFAGSDQIPSDAMSCASEVRVPFLPPKNSYKALRP
jgi:hypothetical protein